MQPDGGEISYSMAAMEIMPLEGVGAYRLGMGKEAIWALNRSPIYSYFSQSWDSVRCDEVKLDGVTLHYDPRTQRVNFISVNARSEEARHSSLCFAGENIKALSFQDLVLLLQIHGHDFEALDERIRAEALGLDFVFYFQDPGDREGILDSVNICLPELFAQ